MKTVHAVSFSHEVCCSILLGEILKKTLDVTSINNVSYSNFRYIPGCPGVNGCFGHLRMSLRVPSLVMFVLHR